MMDLSRYRVAVMGKVSATIKSLVALRDFKTRMPVRYPLAGNCFHCNKMPFKVSAAMRLSTAKVLFKERASILIVSETAPKLPAISTGRIDNDNFSPGLVSVLYVVNKVSFR